MSVSRTVVAVGALALTLTAGLVVGCATGPVPPVKDPARGEFYSGPEMMRVSAAERDRYCSWMESTLQQLKDHRVALQVRLDSLGVAADTLRNQEIAVSSRSRDLSTRVRELRLAEKATNTYIVAAGDNLRKIARTVYGDGARYTEIYKANIAIIGSENAELKAGTRLTIPHRKDK